MDSVGWAFRENYNALTRGSGGEFSPAAQFARDSEEVFKAFSEGGGDLSPTAKFYKRFKYIAGSLRAYSFSP